MIKLNDPTSVEVTAILYGCPVLIRIHLKAPDSTVYSISTQIPGVGMASIVSNVEFFYIGTCEKALSIEGAIRAVESDINTLKMGRKILKKFEEWKSELLDTLDWVSVDFEERVEVVEND